jgi:hypothetical protein
LTAPANSPASPYLASPIAGSVLPIQRAEELLATLPGVVSARIIASDSGAVDEIHLLTSVDVPPKQTVRNVESALIAHLGMRVDHRKISVATTAVLPREDGRAPRMTPGSQLRIDDQLAAATQAAELEASKRRLYFEDVEVRRSRVRGVACRVTLRKGTTTYVGESEGMESERSRVELAARATLAAICEAESNQRALALDGVRLVDAFEREFVFVGITARVARDTAFLTGTCEVRDGAETASALAVLDATNRWIAHTK